MNSKGSALHQSIQQYICDTLPPGESRIEHRLPGHVADVMWLPKNIAFEIQCSPLSIDTAVSRTNDYKNLGLFLVWILHQKTFNGLYLSLAELFLRKHPTCYYTNISITRHGYIFDQTESLKNNRRLQRSPPLIVDISRPIIQGTSLCFPNDRHSKKRRSLFSLTKSLFAGTLLSDKV